ncbi:Mov34/MPN/PAD-1 family protein [Halobacillus karajensis]|uniref:CysO-cysteine peptidase n=2 Tax=Halobacillus karajensis TaxID=195088 RepID=A0A024P391_9BACI|nr:M67 family metallopeptidase [Halobacillus karajensis]CDQ19916.1 CysO-cysteine peptidase [Halobacillus karajensis]CDQ22376.1 CysO-cysteine peptidase [Halobacillus karajensis]CDQ28219.1 CysO-cysteine peptidase [Halobacillus karajensis]
MKISPTLYQQIISHGVQEHPHEACGLVAGAKASRVESVWPLANEQKYRNRYFISKKVVESTIKKVNEQGQKVLGIYHSHPTTAPIPSSRDLWYHPDEQVKMIIISFKTHPPVLKCYTIHSHTYDEHPFLIDPSH